jgi:hypothetical protein
MKWLMIQYEESFVGEREFYISDDKANYTKGRVVFGFKYLLLF